MTEQQAIDKLVAWCNGEVGYHEGAGNWNKYAEDPQLTKLLGWKAQKEPWCDLWTDEAFIVNFGLENASKMTYQPIGKGSAACRYSAQFFKDNDAFYYRNPQVGDVIFFISAGAINHQGIVTGVSSLSVTSVEGNSSDQVSRRVRAINDATIAGYGRPKWSVVATETAESGTNDSTSGEVIIEQPKPQPQTGNAVTLPTLQKGDVSEVVRAAQMLLNGRGCSCGIYGADGDFGGMTRAAVLAFQRRNGLEADGIIGINTWKALLGVN